MNGCSIFRGSSSVSFSAASTGKGVRYLKGGGQGLKYWGGQGGPNSQQAHDVALTSMRHRYVASTSFRRHVPTRFFYKSVPINYISHLKI